MFTATAAPIAWWVTRGMARIIGVNLPQAVLDGWLTRSELDRIVERCDQCGLTEVCQRWLADPAAFAAGAMPGFCPNRPALEPLADG